jgi:uncharacterized damage-inducible protein DinB
MTDAITILTDSFGRIRDTVTGLLDGLSDEHLTYRPGGDGNSIVWLAWHLARVQDDHVADAAGSDQVWTSGGWMDNFGLPLDHDETGYGMSPDEVSLVRGVSSEQLVSYLAAVHDRTVEYLGTLTPADLDRVVDTRWNPPVTLAARLVSVVGDDLQHAGQIGYVRGLLPEPV